MVRKVREDTLDMGCDNLNHSNLDDDDVLDLLAETPSAPLFRAAIEEFKVEEVDLWAPANDLLDDMFTYGDGIKEKQQRWEHLQLYVNSYLKAIEK